MNKILEKRVLTPGVVLMKIYAPRIAKKAEPGQFIIVMPDEKSERIPLTIADYDREDIRSPDGGHPPAPYRFRIPCSCSA